MFYPISFSIPKEKICDGYNAKTKILSNLIPGDISTYIYNTEEEYYNEYKKSYFAITKQKFGWDCMRHYEILANGCIPYFINIEKCPPNTMYFLPKYLLIEANLLYDNKFKNKNINELTEVEINEYNVLQKILLEYTKKFLTTDKMAQYILKKTNSENALNVLFLSGTTEPDYLRCVTLHGFKTLFGEKCHDSPKVPHIYKTNTINYRNLYGKGITYSNVLEEKLHNDNLDISIEEDIKNKKYDLVIYGSYHRGMPYYHLVCQTYKAHEIIIICGEDIHVCDCNKFLNKGHPVFIREL
jgi:hypothetical protein